MEEDSILEWASMAPLDRMALVWELSLEQYGVADEASMEPRLPRSHYRLERR